MKNRNKNARNFGLRNRCPIRAGGNALQEAGASFVSQAVIVSRWRQFCNFITEEFAINDIRLIQKSHVIRYASQLSDRVESGQLMPSTAQDYLSAVNRILEVARGDRELRVAAVRDANFRRRTYVAQESRATSETEHRLASRKLSAHVSAILDLQRELGLRFEESLKIDAARALRQAIEVRKIDVVAGTKGGRSRVVPITNESQIEALKNCVQFQGQRNSLIPDDQTYASFKRQCYREISSLPIRFHGERHWYANRRYRELTGVASPVEAGSSKSGRIAEIARIKDISINDARLLDLRARMTISEELGHSRPEITNNYLG